MPNDVKIEFLRHLTLFIVKWRHFYAKWWWLTTIDCKWRSYFFNSFLIRHKLKRHSKSIVIIWRRNDVIWRKITSNDANIQFWRHLALNDVKDHAYRHQWRHLLSIFVKWRQISMTLALLYILIQYPSFI